MITVRIEGAAALAAALGQFSDQIPFATARALTGTAQKASAEVRRTMQGQIAGGATPYTLAAFAVKPATKASLQSEVGLRAAPTGGTPYEQSIGHLFHGGARRFKRLEDRLRALRAIPPGSQIVPGRAAPIDKRGNVRVEAIREMLGVLAARARGVRNLRVYGRGRGGQDPKAVGFFVVMPGDTAARHLAPGIWKRIAGGDTNAIAPWFLFVDPGRYARTFDLEKIVGEVARIQFPALFKASLEQAIASRRAS